MNSRPLGRNGRLLMPILALLLMNVPVTEAKLDWSEGTKGTLALVGWIILTIVTFSGMVATMVYTYRTLFGHGAIPSEEEKSRRLRESTAWLSYIAWIRVDLRTTRNLERAAAARLIDLESQLLPQPRPLLCRVFGYLFPSKLFSRLFRTTKNSSTNQTSGNASTDRRSRRNNQRRPISHLHISTADGTSPVGKNATQKSTCSAKSPHPYRKSSARETKSTTTEDGGENTTHGSTSSNETANKTRESTQQHVLATPLKAHRAISSKHVESPAGPAASHHGHVTSSIRAIYALDPIRPPWKPLSSSKHVEGPTGPATSHHGYVISPIAAIYARDPIRPAYKPLPSSRKTPYPYHAWRRR